MSIDLLAIQLISARNNVFQYTEKRSSAIELAEEWIMYVFMLVTQILYCSSTSWNYLPQIQQNIGWTEDEMQLSTIHWEFIILCKNGEGITWTQRSVAFSILMPNSSLLRTLNHWDQEIYIRSFFATAQSLLANQVNGPAKTFSYTVMNCVVVYIIVLTYVLSTMRSTLTLKKTAIKLTLLSLTLIWTNWLYVHCCFILLTFFWLLFLDHILFIVVV